LHLQHRQPISLLVNLQRYNNKAFRLPLRLHNPSQHLNQRNQRLVWFKFQDNKHKKMMNLRRSILLLKTLSFQILSTTWQK